MRNILIFLVASCAVAFAIEQDTVGLTEAVTNNKGVVILSLAGANGNYVVTCNDGESTCHIPSKNVYYQIRNSTSNLYSCENVELAKGDKVFGLYCLREVH